MDQMSFEALSNLLCWDSMNLGEEIWGLPSPMEIWLQEPGVPLVATIQLVVYTYSEPPNIAGWSKWEK